MSRTRTFRLVAIALWALATGGSATAQERPAAKEAGGTSAPLTPQEQSGLIDKHRLAVEAAEQLQGLREAGNPHIPEGLELRNIQDDPQATQVDLATLREAAIRRIEDREGFLRPLPEDAPSDPKAGSPASNERAVLVQKIEEPKPIIYPWNRLVLMAAGLLSLICIWVAFRK